MQQPTLKLKVIQSGKNYRRRFSESALLDEGDSLSSERREPWLGAHRHGEPTD